MHALPGNDYRLLIFATTEWVVVDLPLLSGQEYVGRDDRPDGTVLIVDLGDCVEVNGEQDDYLEQHYAVIDYQVVPGWAEPRARYIDPRRGNAL